MDKNKIPQSRPYVHSACKGVTVVSEDGFIKLADPFSQVIRTLCAGCKEYFPLDEFYWEDTGETIAAARARLRSQAPPLLGWLSTVPGFFTLLILGLVLGVVIGIISGLLLGALAGWIIGVIATLAGLVGAVRAWGAFETKVRVGVFGVEDYRQLK
jgi:hypothetical protein